MSLFQARDWWSTNCGSDETFDIGCMVVDNFSQESNPNSQHIVIGSHQGYVRVYRPGGAGTESGGSTEDDAALSHVFCPDDLLLETRLDSPVLSLLSGQFITGSSETCLLVLMPHMVSIFTLSSSTSTVQHGSQYSLSPAYSHRLKRSAFNVFSGRFGGVSNKEQFCVQSLDGVLSVFGRENCTFSCFVPDILLPGPVLYSPRTDSIVTSSSNWTIDSYKYASLARGSEAADKSGSEDHGSGVRMYPDWSFNYGEPAQDLQHMSLPGGDAVIVVLGERSLMFLKDIGTMYMYNHLDYMPSCMINFTNDGGELMTAVCSHSASVYVYAAVPGTGGVLRWTARLSLVPRCMLRVRLHGLRGLLALLSDAGALQAVYMGSTPVLTVAPPIDTGGLDYDQLEEELAQLNDVIDKSETSRQSGLLTPAGGVETTAGAAADIKLLLQVHPVLDPCHLETQMDEQVPCASVRVLVTPCADTVKSVRLHLLVDAPLVVSKPSTTLEKLDRTAGVEAVVYMERCGPVPSLQLRAVASYITASGAPRVLQTSTRLPLALVVRSADPVKEAEHKVTIVCSRPAAHLSQLFSDLGMEAHMSSAAAVRFYGARIEPTTGVDIDGATVTLLVSRSSQRYRLQSDQLHAIWLIADELILRLNLLYNVRQSCSYAASLPLSGFIAAVDDHLLCRQRRQQLLERLEQRAGQLRAVQRRLLTRYRDLSPAPLANLEQLLEDSYRQLVAQAQQVESADTALQLSADQLSCCTRLLQLLVRLSGPQQPEEEEGTAAVEHRERSLRILECAITHCCTEVGSDEQGWEERVDAAVSFLYKSLRADPAVAPSISSAPPLDASSIPTDSGKLKRHVGQLLDKLVNGGATIADTYDERPPVGSAAGPATRAAAVSAARPASARFVQRPTSSRQRPASAIGSGTVRSRRPITQLSVTELEDLSEPVASTTVTDSRGDVQQEAPAAPPLPQPAEADAASMAPGIGVGSLAASSTSRMSSATAEVIESALQPLDDDDQPSEEFW